MRSLLYPIMALLLVVLLTDCNKDTTQQDEQGLTGCPVNFSCEYVFDNLYTATTNNATSPTAPLGFTYTQTQTSGSTCNIKYILQFRPPANTTTSFEINSSDIPTSSNFNTVCPCCDYIALKPLSGHITGKQITNDKWLIDAYVIAGNNNVNGAKAMDTIKVKQYFTRQ